jgi:hypothetical protein
MQIHKTRQRGSPFCPLREIALRRAYFLTLIVETVNSVDAGLFVVSSQQEEVLGIENLVRKKQADGFNRILPTIHVVSQEQVVISRRVSSVMFGVSAIVIIHNFEESQQIVVLPVDVTCHHFITQIMIKVQTLAKLTD